MSTIDVAAREVRFKILYDGPGLSGRTSNLQYVFNRTAPEAKSKMVSEASDAGRTLSFDLLPKTIAAIRGMSVRLELVTVPGAVYFDELKRSLCKDVDGVVFVADSQAERLEANVERWERLAEDLAIHGVDVETLPGVRQFNKRDLQSASSVESLDEALAHPHWPHTCAVASRGEGVFDTLKIVARWIRKNAERAPP